MGRLANYRPLSAICGPNDWTAVEGWEDLLSALNMGNQTCIQECIQEKVKDEHPAASP